MFETNTSLHASVLHEGYRSGEFTPVEVIEGILARIAARGDDHVWIHLLPTEALLKRAKSLKQLSPDSLPLFGLPFALKDNMDAGRSPHDDRLPQIRLYPQ